MTRWLGAALVAGGGFWLGLGRARSRRERVRTLRSLVLALEGMERELGERAPPMAELLAPWTEGDGPVACCFSLCLKGLSDLEEWSFAQVWEGAVREGELPLREEELERLLALGQVLGRCGQESQRLALSRTAQTLTVSLTEAREEERRLGRLDFLLGGAAGLTAAILLL